MEFDAPEKKCNGIASCNKGKPAYKDYWRLKSYILNKRSYTNRKSV